VSDSSFAVHSFWLRKLVLGLEWIAQGQTELNECLLIPQRGIRTKKFCQKDLRQKKSARNDVGIGAVHFFSRQFFCHLFSFLCLGQQKGR